MRFERGPGGDVDGRAAEVARFGLRAQRLARVVDAPEDREAERRVDLDADRILGVLARGPHDALVGPAEDAVPGRVEERPPSRGLEGARRAREIARLLQEEVEVPHRPQRRVRIVEEREDRALERDDLDAGGAQRADHGPERLPQALRAGTGERDFFE